MNFEIAKYNSEKDSRALRDFLRKVWNNYGPHLDESHWEWLFTENPNNPDNQPQIWLIKQEGNVIGQLATIPALLKVKNSSCLGYWAVDLIMDPAERGKGFAYKMVSHVGRQVDIIMALGTNPASYSLFKKLDWFDIGKVPHLLKIINVSGVSRSKIKRLILRSLDFFSSKFLSKVYSVRKVSYQERNYKVEPIVNFDDNFNLLWQRLEPNYSLAVRRDSLFLNWRYAKRPNGGYKIFQASENGTLAGYIVIKIRDGDSERAGVIIDILSEKVSLDCLIRKSVGYFREQRVSRIDCYISDKECERALLRHGFFYWRTEVRFLVRGKTIKNRRWLCNDIRSWRITSGDSDLD